MHGTETGMVPIMVGALKVVSKHFSWYLKGWVFQIRWENRRLLPLLAQPASLGNRQYLIHDI